jgi:hypothetical protein
MYNGKFYTEIVEGVPWMVLNFCVLLYSPLAYVSQSESQVASKGYHCQHSCEHSG